MRPNDRDNEASAHAADLVPLIVGVTGHRDLVTDELATIERAVTAFLADMRKRFPDRPLRVLTPLAEGADRLVARSALALGLDILVVLPMPRALYVADFQSGASQAEFERLCAAARAVHELPVASDTTPAEIATGGDARNRQYAQLGVFLCAHSHVLLALWDGKPSSELGGTAQVVEFHREDVMRGYAPTETLNQQVLANDESDLVYHIVVSRDRPDGRASNGLKIGSGAWLTGDKTATRLTELATPYVRVFERTGMFNREAAQHADEIARESYPLLQESDRNGLPAEAGFINRLFCAADWLAIHYQRKTLSALRVTYSLTFVMGLMFMFYADFEALRLFVLVFFACFFVAFAIHAVAARGQWHARYLEYRALAEGLRVQFYWAAAGVTTELVTKYSHDSFLQKQDIELGWIRNVMRVAAIGSDAAANPDSAGLEFAVREWVGDEGRGGQLAYYTKKKSQNRERTKRLETFARITSFFVVGVLILSVIVASDDVRMRLFLILGAMLLLVGVRQAYAYQVAEKEVIKQYEFMHTIFSNARRRLDTAVDDLERRRILRVLGEAALDEHAQWIFVHRGRPSDAGGFLRLE
jgi:hypothetical protein